MSNAVAISGEVEQPVGQPPLIFKAMLGVMRDVQAVGKDKKNQQQGFSYRGIDDVYNALNDVMAKHGVFTTSEILEKHREERVNKNGTVMAFTVLRMRYNFWAEDGSSVPSEVEGEGMDSGDKSSNKAMAIAHKYALLQAFCIPTQDMVDPDAQTHDIQPKHRIDIGNNKPNTQAAADYVAKQKLAKIEAEKQAAQPKPEPPVNGAVQTREPGDESETPERPKYPVPQTDDAEWNLINDVITNGKPEHKQAQWTAFFNALLKHMPEDEAHEVFANACHKAQVADMENIRSLRQGRQIAKEVYSVIKSLEGVPA